MARRITLEAKIPVTCHIIQASVSLATNASCLLPVLVHVQECGNGATPQSLSEDLFPGLETLSRKLLDMCLRQDLAEYDGARYTLTQTGIAAVRDGMVFADEEGMWKVHRISHPVIGQEYGVLKLERATAKEAGYVENEQVSPPDYSIKKLVGRSMAPVFGRNPRFQIMEIRPYAKRYASPMRASMRWSIDEEGSSISVLYGKDERVLPAPMKMTYKKAWALLLEGARIYDWDHKHDRLKVSYHELADREKREMKKTLTFDPEINGARFERLSKIVDIYPMDRYDAQYWAEYALVDGIHYYVTREEYQKLAGAVRKRFPGFGVSLGDRAEYIPDERTPRFWYMQAMEDWNL